MINVVAKCKFQLTTSFITRQVIAVKLKPFVVYTHIKEPHGVGCLSVSQCRHRLEGGHKLCSRQLTVNRLTTTATGTGPGPTAAIETWP